MKINLNIRTSSRDLKNKDLLELVNFLDENLSPIFEKYDSVGRFSSEKWNLSWNLNYWTLYCNGRERYQPWFLTFKLKFGHLIINE